jgi:hypothetical protein
LETPDGPVFESNAIARYGMLSVYACLFMFIYLFVVVKLLSFTFFIFWFGAVARLGENNLFGSSPIDQV